MSEILRKELMYSNGKSEKSWVSFVRPAIMAGKTVEVRVLTAAIGTRCIGTGISSA